MITLVFNSSEAAEMAFEEYFSEPSGAVLDAKLNRKDGTIEVETTSDSETHLDIPDGLIAIIL